MSDLCPLCGADSTAVDALRARVAEVERERDNHARTLYAEGYSPCATAECNCGGWHGGHVAELRARLRSAAQILIAEVGAGGPMNAEAAAEKAVAVILGLREERDEARRERDARPDPGALLAALDAIRAAAATGARPAELARMIEDVQAGCIRPPTGDGELLGERSCFTCEHAHHDICMLLATKPAGTPLGAIYAYCAASGVDDADDNMPTNRSIRCPGWAAKEPR